MDPAVSAILPKQESEEGNVHSPARFCLLLPSQPSADASCTHAEELRLCGLNPNTVCDLLLCPGDSSKAAAKLLFDLPSLTQESPASCWRKVWLNSGYSDLAKSEAEQAQDLSDTAVRQSREYL